MWEKLLCLMFLVAADGYYVQKKKGVMHWTIMYEDMKFELPCFKTTGDKSKLNQTWTEAPTPFYKDSKNFTLYFNYVRFFDSGDYVCKPSTGATHRHSVLIMSQAEVRLVGSRRYFPKEGCSSSEVRAFLQEEGMQAVCQPDVIVDRYCLFEFDSSCEALDDPKIPYKWELVVTWSFNVPLLKKVGGTLKKCKKDLSCLAKARYKPANDKMATARKRYMDQEANSYKLNPKELGEAVVRAKGKFQLPVRTLTRCPAGTFLLKNVTCQPCPPGKYLPSQAETQANHPESCLPCDDSSGVKVYGAYDCFVRPTGRPTVPTVATVKGQRSLASLLAKDWAERVPLSFKLFVFLTPTAMILCGVLYCIWKHKKEAWAAAKLKEKLEKGRKAKQGAVAVQQEEVLTLLPSEQSSRVSLKPTTTATTASFSSLTRPSGNDSEETSSAASSSS